MIRTQDTAHGTNLGLRVDQYWFQCCLLMLTEFKPCEGFNLVEYCRGKTFPLTVSIKSEHTCMKPQQHAVFACWCLYFNMRPSQRSQYVRMSMRQRCGWTYWSCWPSEEKMRQEAGRIVLSCCAAASGSADKTTEIMKDRETWGSTLSHFSAVNDRVQPKHFLPLFWLPGLIWSHWTLTQVLTAKDKSSKKKLNKV